MRTTFYILTVAISAHIFCTDAAASEYENSYETVYAYTESREESAKQLEAEPETNTELPAAKKKPVPTYVPQSTRGMTTGDNTITMPGDLSSTYETFLLAP